MGIVLLVLGARIFFHRRLRLRAWREIDQFINGNGDRERASVELQRLEFLLSLRDDSLCFESKKLRTLTVSEQRVLYSTLNNEPVQLLAEELACTPSHIYNLRASIRKKLNLNPDDNFRVANMDHLELKIEVIEGRSLAGMH